MLHLIPAPIHRMGLRLAHALRKRWWRLAKPRLVGVNVVLRDGEGRVLLVRHSYEETNWTLLPEDAARREVAEELCCEVRALDPIGVHQRRLYGAFCVTHVFGGELDGAFVPDGREVSEARFFPPDALPGHCSVIVAEFLAMSEQR
jgi:ADP-ribose pyrophosphatase YjhB (NUDIX family)